MYWYWFEIGYDSGNDGCGGGCTEVLVLFIGICSKLDTMVSMVGLVMVLLYWYCVLVLL